MNQLTMGELFAALMDTRLPVEFLGDLVVEFRDRWASGERL